MPVGHIEEGLLGFHVTSSVNPTVQLVEEVVTRQAD